MASLDETVVCIFFSSLPFFPFVRPLWRREKRLPLFTAFPVGDEHDDDDGACYSTLVTADELLVSQVLCYRSFAVRVQPRLQWDISTNPLVSRSPLSTLYCAGGRVVFSSLAIVTRAVTGA